jgi:siroheme synthase-like protein
MAYFPFFVDIENKDFLVVGGGIVALRKVQKLLPFKPKITVVSPKVVKELEDFEINIIHREFAETDIENKFCVITATDNKSLNSQIYSLCKEKNILVNTVDDKEKCTFIFPALAFNDGVTVGISTSGKSPLYAKYIKENIEKNIIDNSESIVESLSRCREKIKAEIPLESNRKSAFERLLDLLLNGEKLNDDKVEKIIMDLK